MSNNEKFRNELAARLDLPPEEIRKVLTAFDFVSADYEIERKTMNIIPFGGMPEVVKIYLAAKAVENLSKETLKQYRCKLLHFFKEVTKPVETIEPNDIRLYLYKFKQTRNIGDRYLESVRITLSGFFAWLVANEYIRKNPCEKVDKIHFQVMEREPLDTYQLEQVRWNCKDIREKALIDFLFSTGCRVSECAKVNKSDINWQDRSVVIRHGKGNKMRYVYFNAESELSLRKYLETRTDNQEALFVTVRKPYRQLQKSGIETVVRKVGARAGFRTFPHRLRHTFATCGLNGGIPLPILQKLMGHEKPETTMIYAKQNRLDTQRAHQKVYA
mgnify:CR=1 FL=1